MVEKASSKRAFSFENLSSMTLEPVWRNLYTIQQSQNLFDDLVSPGKEHILFSLDNATSLIDHTPPGRERVFQYGDVNETIACFDPKYFAVSRFTPGDFGVFYGALEEKTSIAEIMSMHLRRFETNMNLAAEPVIIDRKMYVCSLAGRRCADLRPMIERYPELVSKTYEFCHEVGKAAKRNILDFLVTKSVRRPEGNCIAAFNVECIKGEKFRYFFQLVYAKDRLPEANRITKIDL